MRRYCRTYEPTGERISLAAHRGGRAAYYDLEEIAERWLELLRPVRRELVREQGRERLVTVERCSQKMKNDENFKPSEEELREAFRGLTEAQPLSERMTVAILGVPS